MIESFRSVTLGLTPTAIASLISGVCFQLLAWHGSFLYLYAGIFVPFFGGLATAAFIAPILWPDQQRRQNIFIFLNFIAILFAVVALAPPEK